MVSGGWVVAGLGNPGMRYQKTRHNAGFLLLDLLADSLSASASWRNQFKAEVQPVKLSEHELYLLKPQTFMNLSGEAVQECVAFRKTPLEKLIVIHDEIDIPFGEIRVKKGGGSGGHNGLKSITERLSSPEYLRIRLGVGRPEHIPNPEHRHADVSAHVLSTFSGPEYEKLEKFLRQGIKVLESLVTKGLADAQKVCTVQYL